MSGNRLIQDRLQDALHDVAVATVPESLVPPGLEPVTPMPIRRRRAAAGLLVAAAVVAVALVGVVVRSQDSAHVPQRSGQSAPFGGPAATRSAPAQPVVGGFCDNFVPTGCARPNYQPLWPYSSYTQAERYRTTSPRPSQVWRHSPTSVARRYLAALGYTGIVLRGSDPAPGANASADYNMIDKSHRIVGLLDLTEYGNAVGAPWEVTGYPRVVHPERYFAITSPQRRAKVENTLVVQGQHATSGAIVRVRTLSVTTVLSTARVRSDSTGHWTATLTAAAHGVTTVTADSQGTRSQPKRLTIMGFAHR
jgi:hypothetical protein